MSRSRIFRYDPVTDTVVETVRQQAAGRAKWPLELMSLAVHPSQIEEARERDRICGVPTEYTADGRPVMTGPGHYRRYRKANSVHFNNGYES
jgi:hypothetical protein